jgi:hypothetical protein
MRLRYIILFFIGFSISAPAFAQRTLPPAAKLGKVEAFAYPELRLSGKTYRMSPGAKIFDQSNRIVMPPHLSQDVRVLFQTDINGDLSKVWLLTPDELAREEQLRKNK